MQKWKGAHSPIALFVLASRAQHPQGITVRSNFGGQAARAVL